MSKLYFYEPELEGVLLGYENARTEQMNWDLADGSPASADIQERLLRFSQMLTAPKIMASVTVLCLLPICRAVDPHSFFANPEPAVFLNADPDPYPAYTNLHSWAK